MHDEIRNELEGYLSGESVSRSFTRHLEGCPPCAREVNEMGDMTLSFYALKVEENETITPSAGFYARVAQTIDTQQKSPLWGLFAPDLQFFRQVAFASLMLLAVLGSYLVSKGSDYAASLDSQQATLTEHNSQIPHESLADQQHILVTLAAYDH